MTAPDKLLGWLRCMADNLDEGVAEGPSLFKGLPNRYAEAADEIERLRAERDEFRDLCGQHDPTGADHMEDAARLAEENDRLREAVNALAGLAQTQWHSHGPVPTGREPLDRFVDDLREEEAAALNASLGRSYGSRLGLHWDGAHPVADAIYEADPANEGETVPPTPEPGEGT